MSRPSDPFLCPLPDDQRRLHWLREDLASCLVQIGSILRHTSGKFGQLPAGEVVISAEQSPLPDGSDLPMHPPDSISWSWADGSRLIYHWATHTCDIIAPRA
jgi:hypothetical protein